MTDLLADEATHPGGCRSRGHAPRPFGTSFRGFRGSSPRATLWHHKNRERDMSTRIILDCDPGIDDALAIAFAHGHPDIELAGITTVAGNVGLAKTTANALAVCEFIGAAGTPVTAGCAGPLLRPALDARQVHGDSGLGGARLPPPTASPCRRARHRLHHRHRARRSRRDHAGRDRPADQHRAGRAAGAAAGGLGARIRDHGRVGGPGQRHARRRVQHLGRPGGRRGGVPGQAGRSPCSGST